MGAVMRCEDGVAQVGLEVRLRGASRVCLRGALRLETCVLGTQTTIRKESRLFLGQVGGELTKAERICGLLWAFSSFLSLSLSLSLCGGGYGDWNGMADG